MDGGYIENLYNRILSIDWDERKFYTLDISPIFLKEFMEYYCFVDALGIGVNINILKNPEMVDSQIYALTRTS